MAIGDDAVAAGMDVIIPASGKVVDGATEINKSRDYIAQRTSAITPVAKGGTGSSNPAGARANLGAAATVHTHSPSQIGHGDLDVGPLGHVLAGGGMNSFSARYLVIENGPATMAIAADGVFGIVGSSERFKTNIADAAIDVAAVLAIRVVTFHYRKAIARAAETGEPPKLEHGVIAEQLLELGLDWLVVYDAEGLPLSVHYDRITVALLAVVQDHERRIAALERKGTS